MGDGYQLCADKMNAQEIIQDLISEVIELCEDDELSAATFREELKRIEIDTVIKLHNLET